MSLYYSSVHGEWFHSECHWEVSGSMEHNDSSTQSMLPVFEKKKGPGNNQMWIFFKVFSRDVYFIPSISIIYKRSSWFILFPKCAQKQKRNLRCVFSLLFSQVNKNTKDLKLQPQLSRGCMFFILKCNPNPVSHTKGSGDLLKVEKYVSRTRMFQGPRFIYQTFV